MKLLLDTNILLDCMMDRQPFAADARKLLILGALGEVDLWMSPSQFTDAFYLLTEGGKPAPCGVGEASLAESEAAGAYLHAGGVRHRERAGIVVARLRGRLPLPVRPRSCMPRPSSRAIKPISIARPSPSTTAPSSSPISRTSTGLVYEEIDW